MAALGLVVPMLVDIPDLPEAGERVLGVFLMAVVLWVTEAISLYATAALIILLEILLVSDQAIWLLPDPAAATDYRSFFHALAHPVLMLFLGGFFLAEGASKFDLDRNLARLLLRPFGASPRSVLFGVMVVTAAFSMFMSNTATTATILAVVIPVTATLDRADRLRTGLVLAVPVAANIGGIGTPVGTPPNAIAVGSLADAGVNVSFLRWMVLAVPIVVVLLVFAWWLLTRLFPASTPRIELSIDSVFNRTAGAKVLYVVFVSTVILWLTEPIHGVESSVVGFLPVVVLLATGVFGVRELQSMPWHVLWLVAGGIALGIGVSGSGLDRWMIDQISWEGIATGLVVAAMAVVALAMSVFISNSAAANLLIPIGLTLALSDAVDVDAVAIGFFIAVGASLAMVLPVSTPPNAIAYSTGAITTRDMATVGLVLGIIGWLLLVLVAPLLWDAMGVTLT